MTGDSFFDHVFFWVFTIGLVLTGIDWWIVGSPRAKDFPEILEGPYRLEALTGQGSTLTALYLKAAAGRYQQFTNRITREDLLQGNREFWSLANGTTVPVAQATNLIGGGAYERGSLLVDVEVFAKDLSDLTQFAPRLTFASDELDFDEFFYHGDGTVRGGEVLVQKRTGRHTGWVAYTLCTVEESFPELEPGPFPATHDQRHELKIVNIFEVGKWHLSETFIYASGKPYTEPVGFEPVELPLGDSLPV